MPASEKSNRVLATMSFSCSTPTLAKTGRVWLEVIVGRVLCAATQIEQEAASVWFGWLWVDSAAAVQTISDRQIHADHLNHNRMISPGTDFPLRIRLSKAYNGYLAQDNLRQVTIEMNRHYPAA
jgi:hypothetical protein